MYHKFAGKDLACSPLDKAINQSSLVQTKMKV